MVQATVQPSSTTSSLTFIFVICFLFRLLNAFYTRTYDNPDEYWQGQEVAHELVFGNGYLTWEWKEKIRSFAHPIAIATIYKLIQLLGLEHTHILVAAPRYFQSTLAAIADVATYTLAKKIIGNDIALSIVSCFTFVHILLFIKIFGIAFHNFMFMVQFFDGSKNSI
jgi:phosphatidylinositol glycan class B